MRGPYEGWISAEATRGRGGASLHAATEECSREPQSRSRIDLLLPFLFLLLASCGQGSPPGATSDGPSGTSKAAARQIGAANPAAATPGQPTSTPTASTTVQLAVRIELEPNDYAHRNYCAEGAIAVLLSTWTSAVPSLDAIGVAAHVVESLGTLGVNAVEAINGYLDQITGTAAYAYTGTHVTSLAAFESELQADLSGNGRLTTAGHGSPVLVHVMTATLPGWGGYQAQHMLAVFGYSLAAGTAASDTVTYAESAAASPDTTGLRRRPPRSPRSNRDAELQHRHHSRSGDRDLLTDHIWRSDPGPPRAGAGRPLCRDLPRPVTYRCSSQAPRVGRVAPDGPRTRTRSHAHLPHARECQASPEVAAKTRCSR